MSYLCEQSRTSNNLECACACCLGLFCSTCPFKLTLTNNATWWYLAFLPCFERKSIRYSNRCLIQVNKFCVLHNCVKIFVRKCTVQAINKIVNIVLVIICWDLLDTFKKMLAMEILHLWYYTDDKPGMTTQSLFNKTYNWNSLAAPGCILKIY